MPQYSRVYAQDPLTHLPSSHLLSPLNVSAAMHGVSAREQIVLLIALQFLGPLEKHGMFQASREGTKEKELGI